METESCVKRVETVHNSDFDWKQALTQLENRLGSEVVDRWLAPLRLRAVSPNQIELEAPNPFFRDWVETHYLEALQAVSGQRTIRIECGAFESVPETTPAAESAQSAELSASPEDRLAARSFEQSHQTSWERPLKSKFTFDNFVVGPGSRFAHAASMAVAESPAKAYNPLFIYGGVGLGKTHLMHAMGHAILQRSPKKRVVYLSSEGFTNELISSIQTKQTAKFRDRYRTVDVLLIDDIHFIAGKEATQEEFFHTFNALYDAHKQIVISSDRSPKDISGLEERLVSRFEWGLVTDVQKPDLETRIAILRKKAEDSSLGVTNEVIDFIAQQITSNIRELEGALIRVVAYCNFSNKPQNAEVARHVLKDMVKEVSSRLTIDLIQQRVADYYSIDLSALRGPSRQRSVLYPRQIAMYLVRNLTPASLPEIGKAFGGRDHTTVMHAIEKIKKEISQDVHKRHTIDKINELVLRPGG